MEHLKTIVARKILQIHVATGHGTILFLHVVGKIKVLQKCLNGKEELRPLNTIGFYAKFQTPQLKMLKSLLKLLNKNIKRNISK